MEELKHKFPLTLNDCYDLINTYSQLDPLKPNEIFTYDYVYGILFYILLQSYMRQ